MAKPRTAAQRAATKRMIAANRSKRHIAVGALSRRTKKAPSARLVKRRSRNTMTGYFPNPSRRSRRRRNPTGLAIGNITGMGMTALQGAGGALLINTALNYVPLPAMLQSGNAKYLARAAGAIAIGVFGGKLVSQKLATNMAVGALTVALHDLILGFASATLPSVKLGDVGDYDNGVSAYVDPTYSAIGMNGVGENDVYAQQGVGEYVY